MNEILTYETIERIETRDAVFEVLQAPQLSGSNDVRSAESVFFIQSAGMRLKLVRITLKQGHVRSEPGTLYYMHGRLEMKSSTGGGLMKAMKRKVTSGESFLVNEIHGSGTIYLEPTFGHFILHELHNEAIIIDKSLFYAGSGDLDITSKMNSVTGAVAGGEGLFQTRIEGTGVVVMFSPVPLAEIHKIDLDNETLSVDGNFAMLRTDGISFTVRKSSRSWIATSVSGEGLLQTFTGSGTVWVAPTERIYKQLSTPDGLQTLALPPGAQSGNETGK